jgi:zinc protease
MRSTTSTCVATAATLQLLEELRAADDARAVAAAMKPLFSGAGPRLVLLSPQPVAGRRAGAEHRARRAEKAAPAVRQADRRSASTTCRRSARPAGSVARADRGSGRHHRPLRQRLQPAFKQTDFEKGSVQVQLRFGEGLTGLPRTGRRWPGSAASSARPGLADLDLDAMERLLTGRRIGAQLRRRRGCLRAARRHQRPELADQLRLLATKLAYPRWDAPLFAPLQDQARSKATTCSFASASARAGASFGGGFTRAATSAGRRSRRSDRRRHAPPDVQAFFDPLLAKGRSRR